MSLYFEDRLSDSPYIETVTHGWTMSDGSSIRPAELHWHMVLTKYAGQTHSIVVGPWTTAGVASWGEGAEILWIKFKLGTFMPHLPTKQFLNNEIVLPESASQTFWLNNSTWQVPSFENVETFVDRLVRDEVLESDPVVNAALQERLRPESISDRTLRYRFMHSTGLSQSHIRQMKRAQQAAALLEQGVSILDTVYEAGYFDQPHLTRSMKQFIGYTPAQIIHMNTPEPTCHSIQDSEAELEYDTGVPA